MEISRFEEEFLYQTGLPAGLGSNPVGLDRGELSDTRLVKFVRVGPKVLLVQTNDRYRATSNDPNERRAVEESFAQSILGSFKIESGGAPVPSSGAPPAPAASVVVDATSFFLRDGHGVIPRLRNTGQGTWTLDAERSAFYLERTKAFPKNTEVEVTLTFTTNDNPGPLVRSVAPTPSVITVRQHHSFIELPPPGFTPRAHDPRVGYITVGFFDYATPFTGPVERRYIARHRITPGKPIVFYVDSGAPEPIRSALVEGASWWREAFAAAGFPDAYEVKVLPDGVDPMDVRYNVIHWVHRSTRGWSYGESIVDPRTGEILKGNVRLGSLRIRQDYTIGTGLVPPDYTALAPTEDAAAELALGRIRQLAAHEVGHTLGLDHNMAASTYDRASVMDYPAPMIEIKDGRLDLSNAYTKSIGAYDKWAIRYGYADLSPQQLSALVEEGVRNGMLFVKDSDARSVSAAHPLGSVWDNGSDPVAMLRHEMEVRRIALRDFGLRSIPVGTPLSMLEAKLLPLYLHHRYQVEAAAKSIGGVYFTYAVKTPSGVSPSPVREVVPAARQRDAIAAVVSTLEPEFLALPDALIDLIPPPAHAYEGGTIELFNRRRDPIFTNEAAAAAAASITLSALLDPLRAARMNSFGQPPFSEAVDAAIRVVWRDSPPGRLGGISRTVRSLLVTHLMSLASNASADPQVRAVASESLRSLRAYIAAKPASGIDVAHQRATRDDIDRFLERPDAPRKQSEPIAVPAGPPI
ncbi:MAG TPA: zinc-dependent metalloprotease [Thermoanaerobaculia bacterium]|nr:zinc-dependent metalloprotease [Thermoanaerobaculia bacterium]